MEKNDPYFGMGKNTKVMPQYLAIYLFSWEREGNPYVSRPYIKLSKSALSALPSACKTFRFGQCVDDACQNCPK